MGFPPYAEHFVTAANVKERGKVFEQHMQATSVAMGTLDESQVSGILARALAKLKSSGSSENANQKKSTRDLLHQILLDYIRDMNRDIAVLEKGFEAQFGDAWREEIALRVFDEDEVPKQRPDESIEGYRTRLEKELVDKMLNPDGSIKDKYKNDPELRKYAEWAQKTHNRDTAQQMVNGMEGLSVEHPQVREIIDRFEEMKNSELNTYAARTLESEAQKEAVLKVDGEGHEQTGQSSQSAHSNAFFTPSGS